MLCDGLYAFGGWVTGTTTERWFRTVDVVAFVAADDRFAVEEDDPHAATNKTAAHDTTARRRIERATMGEGYGSTPDSVRSRVSMDLWP